MPILELLQSQGLFALILRFLDDLSVFVCGPFWRGNPLDPQKRRQGLVLGEIYAEQAVGMVSAALSRIELLPEERESVVVVDGCKAAPVRSIL